MLRLRFVPEGDEDDDVDIDFLKSVEEQIRTKLKVRVALIMGDRFGPCPITGPTDGWMDGWM